MHRDYKSPLISWRRYSLWLRASIDGKYEPHLNRNEVRDIKSNLSNEFTKTIWSAYIQVLTRCCELPSFANNITRVRNEAGRTRNSEGRDEDHAWDQKRRDQGHFWLNYPQQIPVNVASVEAKIVEQFVWNRWCIKERSVFNLGIQTHPVITTTTESIDWQRQNGV